MSSTPLVITRGASDVRLSCAVRSMGQAETLTALASIKDAAKGRLTDRDLEKLKVAYESRKNYLRGIKPDTNLPTNEGTV